MALIVCADCKQPVSDEATACPHCGRPVTRSAPTPIKRPRRIGPFTIFLLMCIAGILSVTCLVGVVKVVRPPSPAAAKAEADKTAAKAALKARADDTIQWSLENGVLTRVDCTTDEAYIQPEFWNAMNIDRKKDVTAGCAIHCGGHITMRDAMSGKKLATWSSVWGFSVDE